LQENRKEIRKSKGEEMNETEERLAAIIKSPEGKLRIAESSVKATWMILRCGVSGFAGGSLRPILNDLRALKAAIRRLKDEGFVYLEETGQSLPEKTAKLIVGADIAATSYCDTISMLPERNRRLMEQIFNI